MASPSASPPPPEAPRPRDGWWVRFHARHLFDYPPAATRFWLLILAAGLAAFGWAVQALVHEPPNNAWVLLAGLSLVGVAAWFPVKLPRTTHSVAVADVFVFSLLVTLGAPAAVLAAGLEALIGTLRTSRRLTSWVSSPTSAMAAMGLGGAAYAALRALGLGAGLPAEGATLMALCAVSPLPVSMATGVLMGLVATKNGRRLTLADWFEASTWFMGVTLVSAFVAGLVYLNVQHYGQVVNGVAVALVFALVVLLRVSVRRQEAERLAQEALTADARREAELSQQRFVATFTHAAIGMAVVDASDTVLQANQALCELLGRTEAELVGRPFGELVNAGDRPLLTRQARAVVSGQSPSFTMELRCRAGGDRLAWVAVHCSRYAEPGGQGQGLIYQLLDITSRQAAESRLLHIAFHDSLTDLANRQCFHERLDAAVERTRLDARQRFAVLFLDLDRFKVVNDSLGHIAGNTLLREVARRLQDCIRPVDLVARLGGDEFAILLEGVSDADEGLRLAQRVLATLTQPLSIDGTEVVPGASIGITFSDLGYRTADEVLRDADLAMYEAKGSGRGRVAPFDNTMHARVAEKLALEADLRHAIAGGQLSLHFQPLYVLSPFSLIGFEALARWVHPQRGPISPEMFIALAEESGQIEALTDWVIEQAVAQMVQWRRDMPGIDHLRVNVNISGRDLARANLAATVQAVLQRQGLEPRALMLEITETTLMSQIEMATRTLTELRACGVRFSVDDFGTGYSSLAYLGTLPIDSLKIDRSFVMGLHERPHNVEIVRAVLMLGNALGRKVVAEGIETAEQLAMLRTIGVHEGQGYLLSRPLPADKATALLAAPAAAVH